jgi:hypothetical protein
VETFFDILRQIQTSDLQTVLVLLASQTGTIIALFALAFVGVQKCCNLRPDAEDRDENPLMKSHEPQATDTSNMRKFSEPLLRAHTGSIDLRVL